MARTLTEPTIERQPLMSPTLVRWGAVFAGMVLGFSVLILFSMFLLALAAQQPGGAVATRLSGYLVGASVLAMFLGGLVAGWLSGVPKVSAGIFNGLTVWGLILLGAVAIGVPGLLRLLGLDPAAVTAEQATAAAPGLLAGNAEALWATLLAVVIGALTAGLGGAIGGALTRPAGVAASDEAHAPAVSNARTTRVAEPTRDRDHEHAAGEGPVSARTVDLREREHADAGRADGAAFRRSGDETRR